MHRRVERSYFIEKIDVEQAYVRLTHVNLDGLAI